MAVSCRTSPHARCAARRAGRAAAPQRPPAAHPPLAPTPTRHRCCRAPPPPAALPDAAAGALDASAPLLDAVIGTVTASWPQLLLLAYALAPPGPLAGLLDYYILRPLDDSRTRAKLRAELFEEAGWTPLVRLRAGVRSGVGGWVRFPRSAPASSSQPHAHWFARRCGAAARSAWGGQPPRAHA
jgi:hypothetical protein